MALTLITGRANVGKSKLLNDRLRIDAVSCQPTLLLPQLPDVRRVNRQFVDEGIRGVGVAVFDSWVRHMWSLHGDGRRLVTSAVRRHFVEQAIADLAARVIGQAAGTAGFARIMADVCAGLGAPKPSQGDVIARELAMIVTAYRARLDAAGLIELAGAADVLADATPGLRGPLAVNHFMDLTPAQERLLAGLSRIADVRVALNWEEGSPATDAITPLVNRLAVVASERIIVPDERRTGNALVALGSALFTGRCTSGPGTALRLGLADGAEAECALVARNVRRIIDEGIRPESIAVAFRTMEGRGSMLGAALRAEGVPHVIDITVPFDRTRFGAAFLSVMRAVDHGGGREDLLAFLMSPFSGASHDAVAGLDARWRADRTDEDLLAASAVKELPEVAATLLQAKRLATAGDARTGKNWQLLADRMLTAAHAHGRPLGLRGTLDLAAHRALLSAVGELVLVDPEASAMRVIAAVVEECVSTTQEDQGQAVIVTEAHRLRGRRFDALVLGGLGGSEFEPGNTKTLPRAIAEMLGGPPTADPALTERMLFHTVLTRPSERLVLVRRTADERGEAIRPSAFWEAVLDVYRDTEQAAEGVIPDAIPVERMGGTDVAAFAPSFRPERRTIRGAGATGPVSPRRGVIGPEVIRQLKDRDEFSASEVETYLACPYRWFVDRALSTTDLDALFDARERGSRAHAILSTFYEEWNQSGGGRMTLGVLDEALRRLSQAAGRIAEDGCRVRTIADALSAAKAEKWAADVIRDDVDFLPGFDPLHHELRFGKRHGLPVTLWGVSMRGAIDRVDVGRGGLVVIDYKSSDVSGYKSFDTKGLVQLQVYSAAAASVLGVSVAGAVYRSLTRRTARGFWDRERVDPGPIGTKGDGVDAQEIRAMLDLAGHSVDAAVKGIRAGEISRSPRNRTACRTCGAALFCEADR